MLKSIVSILFVGLTLLPTSLFSQVAEKEHINIILIVADDLGYGDLSCYGSRDISTPNIDQLAGEGVRFTNFYSNSSECTPTRAALLTGRYQQRIGGLECAIGLNGIGRYPDAARLNNLHQLGLPVKYNALPSILTSAGYNKAIIGKWHLGYEPEFRPLAQGFDYAVGPLGGGVDYFMHTIPEGIFMGHWEAAKHDLSRNGTEIYPDGYYLTDFLTDNAVSWLNNQKKERPFFLYLPYTAPHQPNQGPGDFTGKSLTAEMFGAKGFSKEGYVANVEELDRGVGEIVKKVKQKNMENNTIIIFFSDNGPAPPGSAMPFRGHKGQMFEGGIRVPCIIKWPGHIKAGTVSDQVSISMDLTASIARISHSSPPEALPFDGVDIIKDIENNRPVYPRTLFWRLQRSPMIRKAVRDNYMKYVIDINEKNKTSEEYLFDLKKDPGEKENLKDKLPEELSKIKRKLIDWEEMVKPVR